MDIIFFSDLKIMKIIYYTILSFGSESKYVQIKSRCDFELGHSNFVNVLNGNV